jgi:hypothetical protein
LDRAPPPPRRPVGPLREMGSDSLPCLTKNARRRVRARGVCATAQLKDPVRSCVIFIGPDSSRICPVVAREHIHRGTGSGNRIRTIRVLRASLAQGVEASSGTGTKNPALTQPYCVATDPRPRGGASPLTHGTGVLAGGGCGGPAWSLLWVGGCRTRCQRHRGGRWGKRGRALVCAFHRTRQQPHFPWVWWSASRHPQGPVVRCNRQQWQ